MPDGWPSFVGAVLNLNERVARLIQDVSPLIYSFAVSTREVARWIELSEFARREVETDVGWLGI